MLGQAAKTWTTLFVVSSALIGFAGYVILDQTWTLSGGRIILVSMLNSAFRTLQLFTLDGPAQIEGTGQFADIGRTFLHIARFSAPLSLGSAILVYFDSWWKPAAIRRRLRKLSDYDLHWGTSSVSALLTAQNHAAGRWTVVVTETSPSEPYAIDKDSRQITVSQTAFAQDLRDAVLSPQSMMLTASNDLDNIQEVQSPLLANIQADTRLVHIADEQLRLDVVASPALTKVQGGHSVQPFSLNEIAARRYFQSQDVMLGAQARGQSRLHFAFVGLGDDAVALIVHLIRIAPHPDMAAPLITIFTSGDDGATGSLQNRFETLGDLVEARILSRSDPRLTAELLDVVAPMAPVTAWYVAERPNRLHQRQALSLAGALAREGISQTPVILATNTDNLAWCAKIQNAETINVQTLCPNTDFASTRVILGQIDALARQFHAHYTGYKIAPSDRTQSALDPWVTLEESFKASNRRAADCAKTKLEAIGIAGPLSHHLKTAPALPEVSPARRDALARAEHAAWMAERLLGGWRYAPKRDNDRKYHPNIVPYDDLSEEDKDLDRQQIDALFSILKTT